MNTRASGYGAGVLLSFPRAVLWGSAFVLARRLLWEGRVEPLSLSFLRFATGGAALFAFGRRARAGELRRLRMKDVPVLAALRYSGWPA